MNNKLFKTIVLTIVITGIFCINVDKGKAARDWCKQDEKFSKAVTCDYNADGLSNFKSKIAFAKRKDGNVCAEVESVSIKDTGPILNFNQKSLNEQKAMLVFDIKDSTIQQALNSNSCPKLKLVNDFNYTKGYSEKITFSDNSGGVFNGIRCLISGNAGTTVNGSQCWIVDGENFKEISIEEFRNIAKSAHGSRNSMQNIPKESIVGWGRDDKITEGTTSCGLLEDIMPFINTLFFIIQVVGVILLIILSVIEFVKAITTADDDGLKGAVKNTFRRIILAAVLLILPALVIWILNIINTNSYLVDENGNYIVGDDGNPLCRE